MLADSGNFMIIAVVVFFALAALSESIPVFDRLRQALATRVVDYIGFLDVYLNACSTESLELIGELRHKELDYREALIDFMAETLSVPEMLLVLGLGRRKDMLKPDEAFPNLAQQARRIAHFYIDTARGQMDQVHVQTTLQARRYLSRWRHARVLG